MDKLSIERAHKCRQLHLAWQNCSSVQEEPITLAPLSLQCLVQHWAVSYCRSAFLSLSNMPWTLDLPWCNIMPLGKVRSQNEETAELVGCLLFSKSLYLPHFSILGHSTDVAWAHLVPPCSPVNCSREQPNSWSRIFHFGQDASFSY